jgi:hypothetical protein
MIIAHRRPSPSSISRSRLATEKTSDTESRWGRRVDETLNATTGRRSTQDMVSYDYRQDSQWRLHNPLTTARGGQCPTATVE